MTIAYPPIRHVLRDLHLAFAHSEPGVASIAWMPVVPEICNDAGFARAGALAVLVDVIGGGLAAGAAHPAWIATADLTLHLVNGAAPGSVVEARSRVLRAGRTTVVLEVELVEESHSGALGLATMSFSVLPRRDTNPDVVIEMTSERTTIGTADSGLTVPIEEQLEARIVDAARGAIEVPVTDWGRNTMGAMQGGVVALVADLAGETALRARIGRPVVVTDLQLTYLGFGRVGPVCTTATVLSDHAARVELVDRGAEDRRMTLASVAAT